LSYGPACRDIFYDGGAAKQEESRRNPHPGMVIVASPRT